MASSKPRVTLYIDKEDMERLERWADSEYRTVPQLVMVFVKKALEDYKDPEPEPTAKPAAAKTKPAASKTKGRKTTKS